MERFWFVFLKGVLIGGTLTVPGVSGGTMAMVLGIYEALIKAVNELLFGKNRWKNIVFLSTFTVGALMGILMISGIVSGLLRRFPVPVIFFFVGAVAGGIPALLKEMGRAVFRWYHIFFLLGGVGLVSMISWIPQGLFNVSSGGLLGKALGGVIAAVALVLPGISVSHLLYVLGIYEELMVSIASFKFISLLPFGIGLAGGVLATSKAVEYLFYRYRISTYLVILGFLGGSVFQMINGIKVHSFSMICPLFLILGYLAIYMLFKQKNRKAGA